MDYNIKQFKFSMHIDWIRFALVLPNGECIERTEHDIRSPRDLENRLGELVKEYHPTEEPTPIGLELALDAEHEADDDTALAELAAIMWRMNTSDISENQRIYRTRGTATTVPSYERLVSKLLAGVQLAEGNKWDSVYRHGYLKTSDDNNRQACRHRARLEIRLQGQGCPFSTLDALRTFDWMQLREWFRFRRLKDGISDIERLVAHRGGDLGKKRPRLVKGVTRQFSRLTLADGDLRDRAYDALRTLDKRWHRAPRQVSHPKAATTIDREKVGTFESEPRAVTGCVRITTLRQVNNLPNASTDIPTPDTPNTTIGPSPGAQADRARAHRRSGGQAEAATGHPFTPQIIERLFDINREPVAFIESRGGTTEVDDDTFLNDLLNEINDFPDD